MNILITTIEILFLILLLFLGLIIIISLNNTRKDLVTEKYKKMYKEMLLDFAFNEYKNNSSELGIKKEMLNSKKIIFNYNVTFKRFFMRDLFISQAIIIINSLNGKIKKILIKKMVSLGASDYVFRKFEKARSKKEREYYLFRLGELRNKKYISKLLKMKNKNILKNEYAKGYLIALSTLIDEWIDELSVDDMKNYTNKVFSLLERLNKDPEIDLKKYLEIFFMGKPNFFNYLFKNIEFRDFLCDLIFETDLNLIHRGQILNMVALNHQYKVGEICFGEANIYLRKENLTREEEEYLALLIKSLGEIGFSEYFELLKFASQYDNWIFKTIAVKYLYKFEKEETFEILYNMLFDANWWIRYNSALSLAKLGIMGYQSLIKTFETDDKYAKEVASHALVNSDYYDYTKNFLLNGFSDFAFNEVLLIINSGNNMTMLDKLLSEEDIILDVKLDLIENIENEEFIFYFDEVLSNKEVLPEILKYSEKRKQHLLMKKEAENEYN